MPLLDQKECRPAIFRSNWCRRSGKNRKSTRFFLLKMKRTHSYILKKEKKSAKNKAPRRITVSRLNAPRDSRTYLQLIPVPLFMLLSSNASRKSRNDMKKKYRIMHSKI